MTSTANQKLMIRRLRNLLIEAAGNLLKSDIKSVLHSKDVYPTSLSMSNITGAVGHSEKQRLFV